VTAAVLVMARAPRPGACKRRLEPLLGPEGCARLQAVLIARAAAWGRAVAGDRLYVAHLGAGDDAGAREIAALVGEPADVFAQQGEDHGERLANAVTRALCGGGPVLVVGPDLPGLSAAHAAGALGDMAAGCDVSVGPGTGGGGVYLLGVRTHLPEPALAGDAPEEGPLAAMLGAAAAGDLSVGLLRSERELHTPDDARALLADPLTPAEVRAALAPASA
jgi:glycosyltransferase A (GT-A) superfamily protein (DUF2064 family)